MWGQFIFINIHFVLNVIAALVFFMVSWLYFDSWFEQKTIKNAFKIAGFMMLAIGFLLQATIIDSTVLTSSFLPEGIAKTAVILFRGLGYISVVIGFLLDPLPIVPKTKGMSMVGLKSIAFFPVPAILSFPFLSAIVPFLAAVAGFMHIRRATVGLENHLKPIGWGMYVIALYELSLYCLTIKASNVYWHNFLKPYGTAWIFTQIILSVGILIVGMWVFKYLLKRLQSQIFIIYSCSVLVIFILITLSFTWLLLHNIESEALKQLETDVKVLNYSVDSKKAETSSDALALAQSTQLANDMGVNNSKDTQSMSETFMLSKNLSSVAVLDANGIVIARGEDKEHNGLSLSGDLLVKKGLSGENASSIVPRNGIFAPELSIVAVSPIFSSTKVVGLVLVERKLDNAFVDGIKSATGLEVSLYGSNKLSATTLRALDDNSRANGLVEDGKGIVDTVLSKGKFYQTTVSILNQQYLATYMPVVGLDNKSIGMLFVGRNEAIILSSAVRSIQITFILANILLVLSIFPSYIISRYISRQIG